jgi:hypothetical protein
MKQKSGGKGARNRSKAEKEPDEAFHMANPHGDKLFALKANKLRPQEDMPNAGHWLTL